MSQFFTDPASGRRYTVDPITGQSRWVDETPPPPYPTPSAPLSAPQNLGPAAWPVAGHGGYAQQPVQVKKGHPVRNTILIVVAVFLVIGVISSLVGGGGSNKPAASSSTGSSTAAPSGSAKAKPAAPKVAKIGTPVRDGKFQFTITKIKPGVPQVGTSVLGKKAQGQFVLISVTVKNIGDEARTFDGSSQYLYDAKARKFDADSEAGIYLDESNSFLNDINPGNSVSGIIVFDIPKGATLSKLELHDSPFSGGVDVSLT